MLDFPGSTLDPYGSPFSVAMALNQLFHYRFKISWRFSTLYWFGMTEFHSISIRQGWLGFRRHKSVRNVTNNVWVYIDRCVVGIFDSLQCTPGIAYSCQCGCCRSYRFFWQRNLPCLMGIYLRNGDRHIWRTHLEVSSMIWRVQNSWQLRHRICPFRFIGSSTVIVRCKRCRKL